MSALTSTTARSWSGVSSYGKLASISPCHGVSGAKAHALDAGPGRVQLEQLVGEVRDGLADALLRPQPLRAAQLREVGVLGAAVARDPVDLLDRDEDLVRAGEAQLEVVAVLALGPVAAPEHPLVAGDAVVDVDDEVARRQPLEDVAGHDAPERLRPADADGAEQLAVGDEDEAVRAALEAAVEAPLDERDRARAAAPPGRGRRPPGWPASSSSSASRGAWSEARTIRAPSRCQSSTALRRSRRPGPSGAAGSRQPNTSPELRPRAASAADSGGSDSHVSSSVRLATSRDFHGRGPT